MLVVALLMYMLLALGRAHVYERCELARELARLGIEKDHLATWVCIAFHESRFDTAAQNHGSGDHGLLQISELYWCGPGKACGVPCSAFRDEDISDDVECAEKIYKEHTRLQGDGFLAWVVYPLHCKHNNIKKYLADCGTIKNSTENFEASSRQSKNRNRNISAARSLQSNHQNAVRPKPSYLAINSVFEGAYTKGVEDNYNNYEVTNWLNHKIDDIDSLKLPVTKNGGTRFVIPQTIPNSYTSTTTTTTTTTTPPSINLNNIRSPYMTINSLFEGDFYKKFLEYHKQRTDWLDYKVENVDSLKLPVFNKNGVLQFVAPSTSNLYKTTTITPMTSTGANKLMPSYLAIKSLLEGNYYKQFQEKYGEQRTNWLNYNTDNIDSLKVPILSKSGIIQFVPPSTSYVTYNPTTNTGKKFTTTSAKKLTIATTIKPTTTTSDPYLIGIKPPMPRKVESNQFRRKKLLSNTNSIDTEFNKTSQTQNIRAVYTNVTSNMSSITPQFDQRRKSPVIHQLPKNRTDLSNDLILKIVHNDLTTVKPQGGVAFSFGASNYYSTVRPFFSINTTKVEETTKRTTLTSNNNQKPNLDRILNSYQFNSLKKQQISNISQTSFENIKNINVNEYSNKSIISPSTYATTKTLRKSNEALNVNFETKTQATTKAWSHITYSPRNKAQTANTTGKFSTFTFKPLQKSTPSPVVSTTVNQVGRSSSRTQNSSKYDGHGQTSSTQVPIPASKSTPSIFDLYLRPQKFTLQPFQFSPLNTSLHRIQIFSDGTTALPPSHRASISKT